MALFFVPLLIIISVASCFQSKYILLLLITKDLIGVTIYVRIISTVSWMNCWSIPNFVFVMQCWNPTSEAISDWFIVWSIIWRWAQDIFPITNSPPDISPGHIPPYFMTNSETNSPSIPIHISHFRLKTFSTHCDFPWEIYLTKFFFYASHVSIHPLYLMFYAIIKLDIVFTVQLDSRHSNYNWITHLQIS